MSTPSSEFVAVEEVNRLLALAAVGAGLVDADTMAVAQAECRCDPGRRLIDVLGVRGGSGAAELALLRGLADGLEASESGGRERFHPLRRLGVGKLGEVWVAFDIDLERLVALKRLRGDATDTAEGRARLRREAALQARFTQPGIVPIYARMSDAQGRPSHAMRLVSGESLQSEIRSLHGAPGGVLDADRRRALLEGVIQACETMARAHERGVVHRDLHPTNLLREPDGSTFVIGWDHAKWPEGPDPEAGRALGVPGFSAPELARGGDADARADVYSLGAIVFALWTGHVFDASRGHADGDDRALPRGLDTVCRKALAAATDTRYADAGALAEDLRAWRDDRPLPHARESVYDRVHRATRRNPQAVGLGLVSLMVLLISGFAIRDANRAAERARAEAVVERAAASGAARSAIAAAERAASRLEALAGDETVRSDPRLSPFRRQTPEIWRSLFETLETEFSPWLSASQRRGLGSAVLDTAVRSNFVGAYAEGLRAAATAEGIFRAVQDDPEEGDDARLGQAIALRVRAFSLRALRRIDEARECGHQARTLLDRLLAESPSEPGALSEKAAVLILGAMLEEENQGVTDAVRAAYQEAVALAIRAGRIEPDNPRHRERIANGRKQLGDLALQAGRLAEARGYFEQSRADLALLQRAQPQDATRRLELAASLHRLAHLDHGDGDDASAIALIDEGLALLEGAMGSEPERIAHPFQRVLLLIERAQIASDAKQHDDARVWLDPAMLTLSPLLSRNPGHADLVLASAQILQARAGASLRSGDLNDAIAQHALAVTELRRLLELAPQHRDAQRRLAANLGRQAAIELRRSRRKQNDLGHAYQHAQEAIALGESLLDAMPHHVGVQNTVVQGLLTLGETQLSGSVRIEAYPTLQRCDETLRTRAPGLSPNERGQFHARLGAELGQVAVALLDAGQVPEAEAAVAQGLDHLEAAAALGWLKPGWLRRNSRLDPLRGDPRFQGLLADLSMPRDPFQKTNP